MFETLSAAKAGGMRLVRLLSLVVLGAWLSGCATHYLDNNTREVPVAEYKKPAIAKPVQLLFEFQTKGALNTRATDFLKARVEQQVKESGLFSEVANSAVAGGALLSITLNNVPVDDSAFSKGFVTGLTFGLAGSKVSDGYICTINYMPPGGSTPVVKMARHAIHTTLGASVAPERATKVENIEVAVTTMTKQVVSTALGELAADPAFQK